MESSQNWLTIIMILIDYSQVAISAFFIGMGNQKDMYTDEDYIRHLTLDIIRSMKVKYEGKFGEVVICVDGKNPWRKKVFPYYKAKRKKTKAKSKVNWSELYRILGVIRDELIENFHYRVIHIDNVEADDIIATLSRYFSEEQHVIMSSDKDFLQLQQYPNISQYDNTNKRWLKTDNAKEYLFKHILKGDSGDGIPNVLSDDDTFVVDGKRQRNMGDKRLEEIWSSGTSMSELFTEAEEIRRYNRNKTLIDFRQIPKAQLKSIIEKYKNYEIKEEKIYSYLKEKRLVNLLDKVKDFK